MASHLLAVAGAPRLAAHPLLHQRPQSVHGAVHDGLAAAAAWGWGGRVWGGAQVVKKLVSLLQKLSMSAEISQKKNIPGNLQSSGLADLEGCFFFLFLLFFFK